MNKMTKYLSVSLMSLSLIACGGGGSGGSKSTGGNGGTTPTNNPPTLSLSTQSVSMDENTNKSVTITASDPEGKTVTVTSSSDSNNVSVSNTNSELTITANEVSSDTSATVTVRVSDGEKTTSKTVTVSVKNVDTDDNDTLPELTLNPSDDITVQSGGTGVVTISATDADGDEMTITSSDNSEAFSVENTETTLTITALPNTTEYSIVGEATVTVEANGKTVSATVTVTVLPEEEGENNAPTISLAGADEHGVVRIYTDEVVSIPVSVADVDGDEVTWGLAEEFRSSFEEDDNNPLRGVRNYHFDTENNVITIELDVAEMGTIYQYNAFLWVNDGKETVRRDFFILGENRPNGSPVFSFSDEVVAGRVPVDVGGSTTFSYEIIDDAPEHVTIGDIVVQSGDASLFSFDLDTEAQTITVTHNGGGNGDEVSFSIPFTDTQSSGSLFLTAVSREAWGAWQESMMDYVFENRQMIAASKEYEALVHFYADVLENTGIITEFQAHSYKHAAAVDHSKDLDLFVAVRSLNVIEEYVILGQWSQGDETATVGTVDFRVGRLAEVHGQTAQAILEELATLSDGLLPSIPFITSVSEYDSANDYYTRFASGTYGSVQNGKWEFNSDYRFLQAIVEKTRSEVAPKYQQ